MSGKNREAGILEADEHDHHVPAFRRADLLVVRERSLVAVMAVGDQEPPVGEGRAELLVGQPPETGPSTSRSGGPSGISNGAAPS